MMKIEIKASEASEVRKMGETRKHCKHLAIHGNVNKPRPQIFWFYSSVTAARSSCVLLKKKHYSASCNAVKERRHILEKDKQCFKRLQFGDEAKECRKLKMLPFWTASSLVLLLIV